MPPIPEEVEHLWDWFHEIYSGELITWGEIHAWAEITGIKPTAAEALALRSLASEVEKVNAEALRKQAKEKPTKK